MRDYCVQVERGGKLFVFLAGYLWVASYMREGEDLENMNWFIANLNVCPCRVCCNQALFFPP
jgi:hypothetical protein